MRYSTFALAAIVQLACWSPLITARPIIPDDPLCPRDADSSVIPITCFPDGPPDYPPQPGPTRPPPRPPTNPGGPRPIVPDPICLEEEHQNLPECRNPICRRPTEGGPWECDMLKKREAEPEPAPKLIIPDECYKGLPICVFLLNDCGEAWDVYVSPLLPFFFLFFLFFHVFLVFFCSLSLSLLFLHFLISPPSFSLPLIHKEKDCGACSVQLRFSFIFADYLIFHFGTFVLNSCYDPCTSPKPPPPPPCSIDLY